MRVLASFMAICVLAGCNGGNTGGGTAAGGGTFRLSADGSTTLKQSESRVVEIKVSRDDKFIDDINLTAEAPPGSGLSVRLGSAVTKNGDAKADLHVTAAEDAVVGTHKVRVVGTPARGNATEAVVSVKVEQKPTSR